jgi:hypothetical protein
MVLKGWQKLASSVIIFVTTRAKRQMIKCYSSITRSAEVNLDRRSTDLMLAGSIDVISILTHDS